MTQPAQEQWYAYFTVHGDPSVVTDPTRPAFTEVCKVSKSPDDYGLSRTLLIAAAPELLKHLQHMVWLVETELKEDGGHIVDGAKAAIAKATA